MTNEIIPQDPEFLNPSDEWSRNDADRAQKLSEARSLTFSTLPAEHVPEVEDALAIKIFEEALRNIASIMRIESDSAADFFFAMGAMRKHAVDALKAAGREL